MIDKANKQSINFARNYTFILAYIIPITLLGIVFLAFFTIPLIKSVNNDLELSQGEMWGTITINLLVLGLVVFSLFVSFTESSLTFTDEYITKNWLIGKKKLLWSEVVSVFSIGPRITIKTNDKRLQINLYYYRDPDELIIFIRDHIHLQNNTS